MTKPTLSICIPLKVTDTFRRRNWSVCANELSALAERRDDIEIIAAEWDGCHADGYQHIKRVEGRGDFNRSKALNAAAEVATSDLICYIDSDMLLSPDEWDQSIIEAGLYECYSPYKRFKRLGKRKTENRITNNRWRWEQTIDNARGGRVKTCGGNLAGGIFFAIRQFIDAVGGWDERFKNWGYEDTAMCKLVERGGYRAGFGHAIPNHMYHPNAKVGRNQSKKTLRKHYSVSSHKSTNAVQKAPVVRKPWGTTQALHLGTAAEVHRIVVEKDGYCSDHLHERKFNRFVVETGKLTVETFSDEGEIETSQVLGDGDEFVVTPKQRHRFTAVTQTVAYEIYWGECDIRDIQRFSEGGVH